MNHALVAAIAVLPLLQGCATSSDVFLADGSHGYHINCGSAFVTEGDCLEKAGEICGALGYSVVNPTGGRVPSLYGAIFTRDLFIKCK